MFKVKLGTKITIMFLAFIVCLSLIISIIVNSQVREGIEHYAAEKAESDLKLAYTYIDRVYPGEWHIQNGQLFKGQMLINNNYELIDEIGKYTGGTITLFQNDTRVSTNVVIDGERAINTKVSDEVKEKVLVNGQSYSGEANVAGYMYQTAYEPLKNSKNEVVGIFYVGASQSIIDSIVGNIIKNMIIVLIIMVIISILVISLFTASIRKRLQNISNVLKDAGEGKFNANVVDRSTDELTEVAASFNQMTFNLKQLIHNVVNTSKNIKNTSESLNNNTQDSIVATKQITTSIETIANNVSSQQQMVEQSSLAIKEVTESISYISENAFKLAESSQYSIEEAETGYTAIKNVIEQMNTIYDSNTATKEVMTQFEEQSKKISQITMMITSIAKQTNLLSLNAAIESARAGEHGKGFAVVANEVNQLALQSNESANLITSIVEQLFIDIAKVVKLIENSHKEVVEGIKLANHTGSNFEMIVASMKQSSEMIQELSAVSEEMAASMQQINSSSESIAYFAKTTAEDSQNISSAVAQKLQLTEKINDVSHVLMKQSEDLTHSVAKFEIGNQVMTKK